MLLKISGQLRQISLVVFDCDGVLLNSMPAKVEAFRQWVKTYHPESTEPFMRHIMGSFGQSRVKQVEWLYAECLKKTLTPEQRDLEVQRFTDICEPLCAEAGWRPGSREFVEACKEAGIPRFVLSGTPQKPLEDMLQANGADASLFDQIVGSPPAKPQSMDRFIQETGLPAEAMLFIGDAQADAAAAAHAGVHFAYIPSEADRPSLPIATEVSDLRKLLP